MKLTKMDKVNIELVKLIKKVTITKEKADGVMKGRMDSFWKLAVNEIFYYTVNDDNSVTFELA